VYAGRRGA